MEKEDLRTSTIGSKVRWTDVSVLILSLLLAACVATIIYMSLQPAALQKQSLKDANTTPPPQPVNVNVQVDGEKISERVSYDENRNVAFFYESGGAFTAEDHDKGLFIVKNAGADVCFVIPAGNSLNRSQVRDIMNAYHDNDLINPEEEKTIDAQVLPGLIQDTSMFPEEANQQCTGGYMWLTTVDTESESSFETSVREKRQTSCTCRARLRLVYTTSWRSTRILYVYFCVQSCFDSDCTLRSYCL